MSSKGRPADKVCIGDKAIAIVESEQFRCLVDRRHFDRAKLEDACTEMRLLGDVDIILRVWNDDT